MRPSIRSTLFRALGCVLVLGCREDGLVRPTLSAASGATSANVELTQVQMAIERIDLIGATENIPPFKFTESFASNIDLTGPVTRLKTFNVPSGPYATLKVKVAKLGGVGSPM